MCVLYIPSYKSLSQFGLFFSLLSSLFISDSFQCPSFVSHFTCQAQFCLALSLLSAYMNHDFCPRHSLSRPQLCSPLAAANVSNLSCSSLPFFHFTLAVLSLCGLTSYKSYVFYWFQLVARTRLSQWSWVEWSPTARPRQRDSRLVHLHKRVVTKYNPV